MQKTIAFIGAGNMGGAIASRLLTTTRPVIIYDPDAKKCAEFAARGAKIAESAVSACEMADYILLAVCLLVVLGVIGILVLAINTFFPGFFTEMFNSMKDKLNANW